MQDQQTLDTIKVFLTELFEKLGVTGKITFPKVSEDAEDLIKVEIDSEDSNLLIGYHGDTLNALQHILNVMMFREYQKSFKIVLDVSSYRKEREEKLIELAISAADKARFINKSVALYPMNSYERKI
ncbi:protein jag, partial [candidate division WWE3 bacterium CG_4_9_14_3_um_filter_34_6]